MMNNKWIQTCKALKQLFEILSCSKCKKCLHDPQQFLNCGHFSCISCINNKNISCVQCQLPPENGNIAKDDAINKIIQACCTIAKEIGFCNDREDVNLKLENVSVMEQSDIKPSISSNIFTSINSKPSTNLSNKRQRARKRKGKNLNNNEDLKKSKYDSTAFRIPKDINKINHHGETKLQEICKKGNLENIKVMLDAGANPNVTDFAQWTPLQETVDFNYYDVSKLLLDRGANVNQPGYEGRTPLHEAAKNNNIDMINLLLKYKANKESFDKNGKRPVDFCQSEEVRKLLDCDEEIQIVFEKKRNNEEGVSNSFENYKDTNSNAQNVFQITKEQKDTVPIINNKINFQESINIVNTSSINEIERINAFESSQCSMNAESEEIDIMN